MNPVTKSLMALFLLFSLGSFLRPHALVFHSVGVQKFNLMDTVQEPRMNIEEISLPVQIIVYVTDSAGSSAEIGQKFAKILPIELGGFLKKNNMHMAGAPSAWYYGNHFPFVFDVGVAVNKMPDSTYGRIKVKQLTAGNAVVVHFYGPYDQTGKGYSLASDWIKEHGKTETGAPYEVYLGDPGIEKDPYKVLTNIIFPVK
jgi:effector-binding domain-containing protein